MIKVVTKTGNLMNVKAGHIVHGCNAQGVMGSGVALAVKNTYPFAFDCYEKIHRSPGLHLGSAYPVLVTDNLIIWNAVTQNLFGKGNRFTSYDAIATCFEEVNSQISVQKEAHGISEEIHIPLIGAARGGGNWEIIREIIEQTMDYPVTLWLPDSTVTTL